MSEHTLPLELILPDDIPLSLLGGMGEPLQLGVVGTDQFDWLGTVGTQLQNLVSRVGQTEIDINRVETYAQDNIGTLYSMVDSVRLSTEATAAELLQESTIRAEADYAIGQRVDLLKVQADGNTALIEEESLVRAQANSALSQLITTQSARVDDAFSKIQEESTVRATETSAIAEDVSVVRAQVDTNRAVIEEEIEARVTADSAMATQITELTARITGIDSSVIESSEAIANLIDGASASWGIKTQARLDGKIVQTGIQLGSAVGIDGATRSEIILAADILQLVDGDNPDGNLTAPFIFDTVGGTAYLNSAVIQDAAITNAKIGGVIKSNLVNSSTGLPLWSLDKDGDFQMNAATGFGGIRMTSQAIKVYDDANVLRVQLGNLLV